jgi:hypothetical protein
MRVVLISITVALIEIVSAFAAIPTLPLTNEVSRYEREHPIFQSNKISRQAGDELLTILEGGRKIQERRIPPGMVCALPVPAQYWVTVICTNGSTYRIGVSFDGGLVYLPEGLYEVADVARPKVANVMKRLDDDLRREIVSAAKPFVYTVGTVDDGGTLSGLSRLFYGDANKWRQIYETNRLVIKNPDVIAVGMKLTIPKLQ